ncbi:MAG: DoxX family protein [Pseudomonadota bacterium]|nr:MAG: DoxX family protein [Pseudomonadota bacterium]
MNLIATPVRLAQPVVKLLNFLSPLLDLGIRLYVANIFFKSGLTKVQTWDTTVMLFTHEYQVPLLSPPLAAFLGTGAELILPVLLAVGLAGRFSALALFVFNIIAVISYPDLNEIGVKDHVYWGILLLVPLFHGPGKLSLDCWLTRRFQS